MKENVSQLCHVLIYQAMAMMAVPETFNSSNFSYHQRQDGQHDFNSVWEFCYNAFPFMFPTSQNSAITEILSDSPKKLQGIYTLDGRKVEEADKGIYIIDGKRIAKRKIRQAKSQIEVPPVFFNVYDMLEQFQLKMSN